MNIKKIVTHDGTFHTDELFAIAYILLSAGYDIPVERTRNISEDDFNDPSVYIIDVGFKYQPELNNYDHHQDDPAVNEFSAFGLIFRHFGEAKGYYLESSYGKDTPAIASNVLTNLVTKIDAWDNGEVTFRDAESSNIIPLQQVFRWFNVDLADSESQNHAFTVALHIAKNIIKGAVNSAYRAHDAVNVWNRRRSILNDQVIVFDSFCMIWKNRAANQGGVHLAIWPENDSEWVVSTMDNKVLSIADDGLPKPRRIFRHKSGFMAKYNNREDCLTVARLSLKQANMI